MAIRCPTIITATKGDTIIKNYEVDRVTDADTNPETTVDMDLTSATIKFTVKENRSDADADAVFQKTTGDGITITNATEGKFDLKVDPSDTSSLDIGDKDNLDLFFDVQVTLGATNGAFVSGDIVTVDYGTLRIPAEVTL